MKALILGNRYSGKSTAAQILSELVGSDYVDTSSVIIGEFAAVKDISVAELLKNKEKYRDDLFLYARSIQKKDPGYFIRAALSGMDIVSGARNKDEVQDTKKLFDVVLWIDRDVAEKGSTEMVGPEDADITVDNNGDIEQLKSRLKEILRDLH